MTKQASSPDVDLDTALAQHHFVISRGLARDLGVLAEVEAAHRRGRLTRVFPRTYAPPWLADDAPTLERAALLSVGDPAGLSHLTALSRWRIIAPPDEVHVTVPASRSVRRSPGLVAHRADRFPRVLRLDGLVTVDAADALATAWPLLAGPDQRGPTITAVRKGIVTAGELTDALGRLPRLPGRKDLAHLLTLLAVGCESELEIWGHQRVFAVPGLDHGVRQRVFRIGGRVYRSDLAYEDERVSIEMDGDRWHSSREQRERDRRKDAALASIDWLTLRFSHQRLHSDVTGCRHDTAAALAARRGRWRRRTG